MIELGRDLLFSEEAAAQTAVGFNGSGEGGGKNLDGGELSGAEADDGRQLPTAEGRRGEELFGGRRIVEQTLGYVEGLGMKGETGLEMGETLRRGKF